MCNHPEWLPGLVELTDAGGDYYRYIELLYKYYCDDFVNSTPEFKGKPVRTNTDLSRDGKEESFWHILEGQFQDQMADDLGRHKRIRWIRPIIETAKANRLNCWRIAECKKARERVKIKLALNDFSYLVILGLKQNYYVLITAFPIERQRIKDEVSKEWEAHKIEL